MKELGLDRNQQNDRWLAEKKDKVPAVFTTKHPGSVMALGVVCSDGKAMPPITFPPKQRVGADAYCEVMETQVIPGTKEVAAGANVVFQQDSAPTHTAKKTTNLLNESGIKFWSSNTWPPNSPDLNPMDYFFFRGSWRVRCVVSLTTLLMPCVRPSTPNRLPLILQPSDQRASPSDPAWSAC